MQQFGLVVHQLLTRLLCKLQQRILHNGVHRTCLLAISAEDAARQINIVASRTAKTVRTHFLTMKQYYELHSFNVDDLSRTDGFTESAGNASIN